MAPSIRATYLYFCFNFPLNLLHPYDQRMQKIKNFTLKDGKKEKFLMNVITKIHLGIQSFKHTYSVSCGHALKWVLEESKTRKIACNMNLHPNTQYIS